MVENRNLFVLSFKSLPEEEEANANEVLLHQITSLVSRWRYKQHTITCLESNEEEEELTSRNQNKKFAQ